MPRSPEHNLIQFLVTMAIVIGVAIFNWVKKRNQSEEPSETASEKEFSPPPQPRHRPAPSAPPPLAPGRPARQTDWAEELRRLVEGREPVAEPAREQRPHAPVPPVLGTPPVRSTPALPGRRLVSKEERRLPAELPGLTVGRASYQWASHLDEKAAEHVQQTSQPVRRPAVAAQTKMASREVVQVVAMVRNRQTLRSLIMASVILGPPKSLER